MSDGRRDLEANGKDWTPPLISDGNGNLVTSTVLKRVCSWCGKFMGGNPRSERVTHGICEPCFDREMKAASVASR